MNPSHLTLESVPFTILLLLCTKALMVNVIPLWVPPGLSLDAPRGAGLVMISLALGVLDTHRDKDRWLPWRVWGARVPVHHKKWMMFQKEFEIKIVYRIFACASSHPHLPWSAFLLSLTTIVLVLCEVQVGLHPPGQSVKRTLQAPAAATSLFHRLHFPPLSPPHFFTSSISSLLCLPIFFCFPPSFVHCPPSASLCSG